MIPRVELIEVAHDLPYTSEKASCPASDCDAGGGGLSLPHVLATQPDVPQPPCIISLGKFYHVIANISYL